jgi:3-phytase
MPKKRSRGRPVPGGIQLNLQRLLDRGLVMWLGIAAVASIALVVLLVALLSPRSESSSSVTGPSPQLPTATPMVIAPTAETQPVPHTSDAADDVAIWIHPTDPSLSTVLGTDKLDGGGLGVYDLAGKELYFYFDGSFNNVDLRYNFPLGGNLVTLVGVSNRTETPNIVFYTVNVTDRSLTRVGELLVGGSGVDRPRGFAMYHSPVSGRYYALVTDFRTNIVLQFELDGTTGSVTGSLVRTFDNGDTSEGMVADDELQYLYVSEEDVGIWRYGAEPETGAARTLVDGVVASGGNLTPNIKNLAIYYRTDGGGYLIASSQGAGNFAVYDRVDNRVLGAFEVDAGNGVDSVSGQDGIEVTNFALGAVFPQGLFVTQDHVNSDAGNGNAGNQNYKLVAWEGIATTLQLTVDTSFDPRRIGAPAAP